MAAIDLTGMRFGKLTAMHRQIKENKNISMWECSCDCGGKLVIQISNLRNGKRTDCGCVFKEFKRISKKKRSDGTYVSWQAMRTRTTNESRHNSNRYVKRGILCCPQWESFDKFLEDMGHRPPGTTLDRINNDGNYELGNCRWSSHREQRRNTSISKLTLESAVKVLIMYFKGAPLNEITRNFGIGKSLPGEMARGNVWPDAAALAIEHLRNNPPNTKRWKCNCLRAKGL